MATTRRAVVTVAGADDSTALDGVLARPAVRTGKRSAGRSGGKGVPKVKSWSEKKCWAYAGVGLMLGLSGWLNGLAFAEFAPSRSQGWALGLAIPVMLLIGARVGALCWMSGQRGLGCAGGIACLSVLALSVQHCAVSISRLTGEHVALAALMAVSLDGLLVICELATISLGRGNR